MKVLIVEDDRRIADSIKKGLKQERIIAEVAYFGMEGLDLASTEDYDVIILDILLPEINGLEFSTKLRKQNITTPILMLTALSQTNDKVTGLNQGADDYLTKPFDFDELLARVRALGRRSHTALSNPILKINDLKLNTYTYQVQRGDHDIRLSQKEFALLEYLMLHENQVLSKEKIMDNIWSFDEDVLPNTIEVYIKNLRQKLERPFPQKPKLIHTVRGFGYKIKDSREV
jgi:DNA-binding response OmpR family regulator